MSRHHENVIWQSADGTWNRGMFERMPCGGSDCKDETHEWCDDFDQTAFEWVSAGHPTLDAADQAWDGSNPGGFTLLRYDPANQEQVRWIEAYEDMAAVLCEAEARRQRERPDYLSWGRYRAYSGPTKTRSLAAMQRSHNDMVRGHAGHRLGGYANLPHQDMDALGARIAERLKTASPAEVEAYERADAEHRDGLRTMLAEHRDRRRREAQNRRPYGGYYYDPLAAQRSRDRDAREAEMEAFIAQADADAAARIARRAPKEAVKAPAAKKSAPPPGGAQGRQPKGIPAGGQFTASARAEATVALTPPAPAPAKNGDDFDSWGNDPWA